MLWFPWEQHSVWWFGFFFRYFPCLSVVVMSCREFSAGERKDPVFLCPVYTFKAVTFDSFSFLKKKKRTTSCVQVCNIFALDLTVHFFLYRFRNLLGFLMHRSALVAH